MTSLEIVLMIVVGLLIVGGLLFQAFNAKSKVLPVAPLFTPPNTLAAPTAVPVVVANTGGLFANPVVFMLGGFILAGMIFYFMDRRDFVPNPTPNPNPSLSLVSTFETNNNRAEAKFHARVFGTICTSLADIIEYDSKLTAPRIATGVDIDNLRRAMREYRMKGASFSQKYPELSPTLDRYFKSVLGSVGGGGKLTPDVRLKWISLFRAVATATEQVNK